MSLPVSSWPQWFEACARYYKDVRMKMAYYEFGQPLSPAVIARIHRDVMRKFPARKDSVLLDVGGGVGLFSRKYAGRVRSVVLTDIVPKMLHAAQRLDPHRPCLACEASKLPFKNHSFDRVLCYSVFHYLSGLAHARKVLNECVRVLRRGGVVFIGDVLYPDAYLKSRIKAKNSSSVKKSKIFWPRELSHRLDKKKFSPDFFKNFCRKRKLRCSILAQTIPGKATSATRYDVLIRKD